MYPRPPGGSPSAPIAVIPDLHGHAALLDAALDALPHDCGVVLLGDLIDRGPDSAGVVARVLDLIASGRATLLLGNHEQLARSALAHPHLRAAWLDDGGAATEASYAAAGRSLGDDLTALAAHTLPWTVQRGWVLSHAGRPPMRALRTGQPHHDEDEDYLWSRPEHDGLRLLPEEIGGHAIRGSIHGHTIQKTPTEIVDPLGKPAWYIDLGAWWTPQRGLQTMLIHPGGTAELGPRVREPS